MSKAISGGLNYKVGVSHGIFCIYFGSLKLTTQLTNFFAEVKNGIGIAGIPLFQSAGIFDRYFVLNAW